MIVFLMTIFDDIETIFDNWKDSPGELTFETLITILTIESLNSVNHSYLTINCDAGQHLQFLRCLFWALGFCVPLKSILENEIVHSAKHLQRTVCQRIAQSGCQAAQ